MKKIILLSAISLVLMGCDTSIEEIKQKEQYCKSIGMISIKYEGGTGAIQVDCRNEIKPEDCYVKCRYAFRDLNDTWGSNADQVSKSLLQCIRECEERLK